MQSANSTAKTDTEVLYSVADHVATMQFNCPDHENAISSAMLGALSGMLVTANEDPEVRAIVITGSGRFVCAGLDLRGGGIASGLSGGSVHGARRRTRIGRHLAPVSSHRLVKGR